MTTPAIPTPEQVRSLRTTSVRDFQQGLKNLGLTVREGGSHLRIETANGAFVWSMPLSRATPQALLNCRSHLARRVAAMRTQHYGGNDTH